MKKYISLFLASLVFLTSTLFAVPASAHAATLKLNSVRAALLESSSRPTLFETSTSENMPQIVNAIDQITKKAGVQAIAGAGGAFVGASGGESASLIDSIANTIPQKFPDELYIKVDGVKVWPSGKYQDIKAGQKIDLNLASRNFRNEAKVVLFDYDTVSSDDNLGEQTFKPDSQSGEYMLYNKENGSVYFLNVSVTP